MSASTPLKRFKQVYVDIPPSPFHSPKYRPSPNTSLRVLSTPNLPLKENRRSKNLAMTTVASSSTPLKRKHSDRDLPEVVVEISVPTPKKARVGASSGSVPASRNPSASSSASAAQESGQLSDSEDAYFYCHQCSKKRDTAVGIRCSSTVKHAKSGKERNCSVKFCKPCLRNRYDEDIATFKGKENQAFKCPRCRGICNCWRCRKAQGMPPMGKFAPNTKSSVDAAPISLVSDTGAVAADSMKPPGPSGKHKAPSNPPTTSKKPSEKSRASQASAKPPRVRKPKPKPLPEIIWSPVPTELSLNDAEQRIQIRAFVLRFHTLFSYPLAKAHLDELDEIDGRHGASADDGLVGWISEPCLKGIIQGLLGLLADQSAPEASKEIRRAIQSMRSSGSNLWKVYSILASLRDEGERSLSFPEPLPGPSASMLRVTRHMVGASNVVNISFSAQMVPIVLALQDAAMMSHGVREEIENGVNQGKEVVRDVREAVKAENERWDQEKVKDLDQGSYTTARLMHKRRLLDIEAAHEAVVAAYLPRTNFLGRDHEGRIYWALPPGCAEQDSAMDFLESCLPDTKPTKKRACRKGPSQDVADSLTDWSFFVAVWGKKPEVASKPNDSEQAWWGFSTPEDIRKLALWISLVADQDAPDNGHSATRDTWWQLGEKETIRIKEDTPGREEVASLVKSLEQYADTLYWRMHYMAKAA
ncbi:hypothetical protein HGRIS_002462 [Hohenbuehelia grisea]|uniref:Zinc-finger domain-containing protein n=1 Tax=Hohenbuehelia grisea TaxID=104357 RepID=A0ABR3JMG2_9AGAR